MRLKSRGKEWAGISSGSMRGMRLVKRHTTSLQVRYSTWSMP
ncbi:hypothetical protein ACFFX0_05500 [Citricoccus parietis]|uniref:Uncharacterized protein n=1 Tax=Citricoccus parietis TaxID=592307 RepID=A0ABV5FVL0_9MICC